MFAAAPQCNVVFLTAGMSAEQQLQAAARGVAWSLTGAGLSLGLGSRRLAPRLVLSGYRPWEILAGQLLLPYALAAPLVGLFAAWVLATERPPAPGSFVAAVALTAVLAAPSASCSDPSRPAISKESSGSSRSSACR